MALENLFEADTKPPKLDKTRINLFVPNTAVIELNKIALRYGIARTAVIMQAISEKLEREEEAEKNKYILTP